MNSSHPTVSIIVVTVNTPKVTATCLESVRRHTTVPHELIVVNNSRARAIRQCLKKFRGIQIIQNPGNFGYTRAANQGAIESTGEFLCFLNSDTIVPPQWMERLLKAARLPGVGAVNPLGERETDHRVSLAQNQEPHAFTELTDQAFQHWHKGRLKNALWLCGFCLVIPRAVMARHGLFDERFFFGWEDVDYTLRLCLKGYRLLRVESLFVYHTRGASSNAERRRQLIRHSKKLFLLKWGSLFKRKFSENRAVFTAVDRRIKHLQTLKRFRSPFRRKTPYFPGFLRTGYALRSAKTLIRLSDLGMFALDAQSKKIWETFDQHPLSRRTLQYLDLWSREGLIRKTTPAPLKKIMVTVMMTAHNAERWIAEAIESVLAQEFKNFELLIVDDGSTDRTAQIIHRYRWDPRLKFFQNERQLGIAPSRNLILNIARGKYIAVCDADDLMRPALLQHLAGFLEDHRQVGWVYTSRLYINEEGRPMGVAPAIPMNGIVEYRRNVIQHAGSMIRRKLMLDAGGYDPAMSCCEDYDLALKISKHAKILALSGESHYLYRRHSGSASRTDPWAARETMRLLQRHRPRRLHKQTARRSDCVAVEHFPVPAAHIRLCGEALANKQAYVETARREAQRLIANYGFRPESSILDIGCGHGRLLVGLLSEMRSVRYVGMDVSPSVIQWCRRHFKKWPEPQFIHLDVFNERYHVSGSKLSKAFRFPLARASQDFIYLFSVFSHMREYDMKIYLRDFRRLLRPNGRVIFTAFTEENVPNVRINPPNYIFKKCQGALHIVRYRRQYLFKMIADAGFQIVHFGHRTELDAQSLVVLKSAGRNLSRKPKR